MKLWILVFGDTGNSIWTENLICFEWDSGSKLRFCEVQVVSYLHSTLLMHYKYKVCIYSNEVEFIFHQKETGVLDNFMQSANSWVNIKFMPCSSRHDNFLIYKYLIQEILVVHDFLRFFTRSCPMVLVTQRWYGPWLALDRYPLCPILSALSTELPTQTGIPVSWYCLMVHLTHY